MPARTVASRLALVAFGLVLAALVLESGLQLAALAVRATGRMPPASFVTGKLRVLCVGDSNTYGLHLPREDAYPRQLERLWTEAGAVPPVEVLNFGVPGTNSSYLLRELPRMIDTLAPDVVIAMIGVNDFWTLPVAVEDEAPPRGVEWLARHSRLYRGLRMLRRAFDSNEVELELDPELSKNVRAENRLRYGDAEFRLDFARAEGKDHGDAEDLERNLHKLVSVVRERGVALVMMDYPSRFKLLYPHASRSIRKVAERTGTPLVSLSQVFAPLCPDERCPRFLLADHHPNAEGYRIIATTLVERLPGLLAAP